MTDDLTDVLERAAGPAPPAPTASTLMAAGRRRRRRSVVITSVATVTVVAALGAGIATLLPSQGSPDAISIIDRPLDDVPAWQGEDHDLSVFLCDGTSVVRSDGVEQTCPTITPEQLADLVDRLRADQDVQAVYFESKQAAYERVREHLADQPDALEGIDANALPAAFRLALTDPTRADALRNRLRDHPGVEEVVRTSAASNPD